MNVLHLISSEGFYGAEAMLVTLASVQNSGANSVVVAGFSDSRRQHTELTRIAAERGLTVETVECNGRWDPAVPGRLRQMIEKHSIDVLHTHGYKADFYGYRAAKACSLPLVSTCHNWPDKRPLMRAYAVLDRWILKRFDKVVAVSEPVADTLRQSGLPEEKLVLVSNGVDVDRYESALPVIRQDRHWARRPVVGFAGRLSPAKGGAVLLDAARIVLQSFPRALFVFAGDGPAFRDWRRHAERLGISANVEFIGPRNDMPEFYSSIDVLVLPSYEEAMPMAVLEAMAARKPVIASRVGGLPNLVKSGWNGELIEPGDAAGFAAAILNILRDTEGARTKGERGQALVGSAFSAKQMASRYIDLYREAIQRHA